MGKTRRLDYSLYIYVWVYRGLGSFRFGEKGLGFRHDGCGFSVECNPATAVVILVRRSIVLSETNYKRYRAPASAGGARSTRIGHGM